MTVLANDGDADGDVLALAGVADPAHGSASISGTTVVYSPDVDFVGTDTVVYTVGDGRGGEDSATLTVTVVAVNDDPDPEDDALTPGRGRAPPPSTSSPTTRTSTATRSS